MGPFEIAAAVRRHLFAVVVLCVLAIGIAYTLERADPGYQQTGTVAVSSGSIENSLFTYTESLSAIEEILSVYMAGPEAESSVLAAGGYGSYSVARANQGNEQLPYYKNPYLNITTTAASPATALSTYKAAVNVLEEEFASLQRSNASASNKIEVTLISQPGTLISLRGSRVRSLAAIAILTVIGALMSAYALDRRVQRRHPRLRLERADHFGENT